MQRMLWQSPFVIVIGAKVSIFRGEKKMIGYLEGNVLDKEYNGKLLINVAGVGYEVETSLQTLTTIETLSNPIRLFIQTIVREDAFLLYGFYDKLERSLFRALIKVNGIGPKLALTILSSANPASL